MLLVLLAGWIALQAFLPLGTAVQIGADEGFELAKATLWLNGHGLYTEVWNDQPPLHTFLVVQILKHLSPGVLGPRLVTVIASWVLLAGIFWITYRVCGVGVAGLMVALLMVSPGFLELSASCMLEIPAVAPAVLALAMLCHGKAEWASGTAENRSPESGDGSSGRGRGELKVEDGGWETRGEGRSKKEEGRRGEWCVREIVAGFVVSVALLMKLVPAVLLPLAALIIWLRDREGRMINTGRDNGQRAFAAQRGGQRRIIPQSGTATKSVGLHRMGQKYASATKMSAPTHVGGYGGEFGKALRALILFSVSVVVGFVVIDLLIEGGAYLRHFQQSWTSHFGATRSFEYGSPAEHPFDWNIFLKNWDLTIPACVGVALCLRRRQRSPWLVLPVAWLGLMILVLATHRPWWSYYYIHIALPLCWCAAIGIAQAWECARKTRGMKWKAALSVFGVCAVSWMGARVYLQAQDMRSSPQLHSSLVLQGLERLKPFTRFLYADESIYSFHAGIPMPPNLAVMPLKRFWSGHMTNARLAAELEAARPELMLLKNDTRERPFQRLLQSEYRLVYQDPNHRLFARRATAKAAGY